LIQKQPDEISIMRVYAVSCSMTLRDKAALEVNKNIYSKDSNDFTSMVNLGYALWQVDAYDQAKELFQKAHALNSHNVDAILGLMLTYYKTGELNRVLQLNQKLSVEMPSWSSSSNKIDLLLEQGYLFTPKQAEVIMRF
jgi:tetratricopeptide (TPR) repeat protein